MPVSVALVGPAGSGKTTLFTALVGGRAAEGMGMVDVPDPRLDRLAAAVRPKKIVSAQVRIADAPQGSRAQRIAAAREADVILEVARGFGPDPDPAADLAEVALDLVLTDLASVDRRLEIVGREARGGLKERQDEVDALEAARAHLDAGQPLSSLTMDSEAAGHLAALFLVSLKPAVCVANVADELLPDGGEPAARARDAAAAAGQATIVLSAQLELELGQLDPGDRAEYRATYGAAAGGLEAVARAVWDAGGLVTYFTAGEPEVRAWPVERDSTAVVAAGKIHSDFESHFIRAEVASVDELVEAGSMDNLRAAGRLRIEGRDYRVQDGDVVLFRIGKAN